MLAPTLIQHKKGQGFGNQSITWTSTTTAGSLLVVVAGATTDIPAQSTISTPTNWTAACGPGSSAFLGAYVFFRENAPAQAATPTFNPAGSGDAIALFGFEVGGDLAGATGTKDKTQVGNGNSATTSTGTTATTTQAAEIWIGGTFNNGTAAGTTPQNGFTLADSVANQQTQAADTQISGDGVYKIVAATGTAQSGVTISSGNWQGAIATFMGAAAATALDEEGLLIFMRRNW